jgi:hypothetical protein
MVETPDQNPAITHVFPPQIAVKHDEFGGPIVNSVRL